jgi:hypothetical protein
MYFKWRFGTGTLVYQGCIHYAFVGGWLVEAALTPAEIAFLDAQANTYAFPANMDTAIAPNDELKTLFESFNVPTDWLTAATTYRQFIRKMGGIIEFCKRYMVIAGDNGGGFHAYLWNSITLDTRYRNFPSNVKTWFDMTVASYGIDPGILKPNSTVRQMLKSAADAIEVPVTIGGVTY